MRIISTILIVTGLVFLAIFFGPLIKDELWFFFKELKSQDVSLASEAPNDAVKDSVFSRFLSSKPIAIEPVNTDFAIVIEKIGVNAPVNKDVSITDEKVYIESLRTGIAHASVSRYPSEKPGNVYLFAHASINFWRLGKYSNVFNLLRKLELGDRIHIFYEGKTFVYEVLNKEVVPGWNTYPITRPVIEPTLTLQTCDPPGTTLNRLVVTSKLIDVE